ncbi:hypothetical protein CMEL01_13450 [Colletotrichum melonis]|uniref:Uncharacterized protein n=1 Tax=Colletotrichum melonis TaxID=1209925 RepID=A0AAI9UUX1_9PEZI|nr:hypothetical protein CMEL01_13450 [Colletotrichum melonis]
MSLRRDSTERTLQAFYEDSELEFCPLTPRRVLFVIHFLDPTDWMKAFTAVCADRDKI